jgi:hypothetical protein
MVKGNRCRGSYRRVGLKLLCAITLGLAALAAGAVEAPVVPPTSSGSYTVTYQRCSGCYIDWLEERVGESGAWQTVGAGPASFSNKAAGRYYYRVGYLYLAYDYSHYTDYSGASSVLVGSSLPTVSPLETQLKYRYEARRGDINGDGRTDLYLARIAGGAAGDGTIDRVLLRQGSAGRFAAGVPTAAEAVTARNWPTAALRILLKDVNIDGFTDLVLHGVAGAIGASGIPNQIVYAPGKALSFTPKGIRGVDAAFKKFAMDTGSYLREPDYFMSTAPLRTFVYVSYQSICTYGAGTDPIYGYYPDCYLIPVTSFGVYRDYSVFDQSAIGIWNYETAIERKEITAKSGLDQINGLLQNIVGVGVGGWTSREILDTQRPITDVDVRRGIEMFTALLRIGEASAATPEESGAAGRNRDIVYITGRRVIGFLPMHTALEYRGSTVSAYDSDDRILFDGTLVSRVNWMRDRPLLMMTLGTVSSVLSPLAYWSRILTTDSRYRDNLPYDALPSLGRAGYNSNGYSRGIVQATSGSPSIPMDRFVGGEKPVPASAFN